MNETLAITQKWLIFSRIKVNMAQPQIGM